MSEDKRLSETVERTVNFVRKKLGGEGSGHDWWHVYRVYKNALTINQREQADPLVVSLAALLHDIADHKFHNGDTEIGPRVAKEWLENEGIEKQHIDHIGQIIRDMSFKGAEVKDSMGTLEGKIVQDADRLDAIGAIGIARAFAYGGHKGREMHTPGIEPRAHATFEDYKNSPSSAINHFHEKLLLLKDRMNTATAKGIAEKRHAFMLHFLETFMNEWGGI